jgi:hypothetical protein
MFKLNAKAHRLLAEEVMKVTGSDPVFGESQQKIVLQRLDTLRDKFGAKATAGELELVILDVLPTFNRATIEQAAAVNQGKMVKAQGSGNKKLTKFLPLWLIVAGGGVMALVGLVSIANLPYPMIRRPIARVAPILLLPSYIEMDENYRGAISNVEQADQFVNAATSREDIEIGAQRVAQAQANLDKLPVWFLGYEPQRYCQMSFMSSSCSWQFTLDEYEEARTRIGRMEAKVVQEKNALDQLEQAIAQVSQAQADYAAGTNPSQAMRSWQLGMDQLMQLPPQTLAGSMAQGKLVPLQRDYNAIAGASSQYNQGNNLMVSAKNFAGEGAKICQNPPHPVTTWQECISLWTQAIERLNQITVNDLGYNDAQKLLAQYQSNVSSLKIRMEAERVSSAAYDLAQQQTNTFIQNQTQDLGQGQAQLQSIINELKKVQPGTTHHSEAQQQLKQAQVKLKSYQ